MDQIIARIASAAGISEQQAESAVKIILNFLSKEAPEDKMRVLTEALGASGMVDAQSDTGGGLMGGLLGSMGGMGGAMAAMNELSGVGLGMGEIKTVAGELVDAAKERVDSDLVDEIISSVPGLGQIL